MAEAICRIADWGQERDELMAIRHQVFVIEQQVPVELEWDEHDETATHFVVELDGDKIATGRLKTDGQIGRMAVLAPFRRQGIGQLLLQTMLDHAGHQGMTELYLHSQLQATGFYGKAGFVENGEDFLDAGIVHRAMVKICAK